MTKLLLRKVEIQYLLQSCFNKNIQSSVLKFRTLIQHRNFNRITSVYIYKQIHQNKFQKTINLVKTIDRIISQKNQKQLRQSQHKVNQSIFFNAQRFLALIQHNHYDDHLMITLQQHILTSNMHLSELVILIPIFTNKQTQFKTNYNKLQGHIYDLLLQTIGNQNLYPTKLIFLMSTIFKSVEKKLLLSLNYQHISQLIENILSKCDYCLFYEFLQNKIKRPLPLLKMLSFKENSLVKKRIIYEVIIHNHNQLRQFAYLLPGGKAFSQTQLKEAFQLYKLISKHYPFADIFGMTNHKTNYLLKKIQTINLFTLSLYVDYIYFIVKNHLFQLKQHNIYNIIQMLHSFINRKILVNDQQHKLNNLLSDNINTHLKYLNILMEFKHLKLQSIRHQSILNDIASQYLQAHFNQQFAFSLVNESLSSQINSIINVFLLSCLSYIRENLKDIKIIPPIVSLQNIHIFLDQFKDNLKYRKLTLLRQFHNYSKYLIQSKFQIHMKQPFTILSMQKCSKQQLIKYLQTQVQGQYINDFTQNTIDHFLEQFLFTKNVYLQSNIFIPYAIIDMKSNKPIYAFQFGQFSCISEVYRESSYFFQRDTVLTNQQIDLNLYGIWKRQFFHSIFSSAYFCCRTEFQFNHKLRLAFKNLSIKFKLPDK